MEGLDGVGGPEIISKGFSICVCTLKLERSESEVVPGVGVEPT